MIHYQSVFLTYQSQEGEAPTNGGKGNVASNEALTWWITSQDGGAEIIRFQIQLTKMSRLNDTEAMIDFFEHITS